MDGELDEIRLKPADGGYTIHVDRARREGQRDAPYRPNRPKIAMSKGHAMQIIAKELGAKGGTKGRKVGALAVMAENAAPAGMGKKSARRKSGSRKRA